MPKALTIGRVARAAGVGVETVRFYERRGLIARPPRPSRGGFRTYDAGTIDRIRFIRRAQQLGFSLREIAELLSLRTDPAADCADVRLRAQRKRREVERRIADLGAIRDALDELIAACPGGGGVRHCTILGALSGAPATPPGGEAGTDGAQPLAGEAER